MDKDLASNPICAWKKPLRCPGTESAASANVQSNSDQMPVTRQVVLATSIDGAITESTAGSAVRVL